MKFTIEMDCDNDSFHADVQGQVRWIINRALTKFARHINNGDLPIEIILSDDNGNKIGVLKYIDNNKIKEISEEDARFAGIIS